MESVVRRHAQEQEFTENQIRQLHKPRMGRKPITEEELAMKANAMREQLKMRHQAELIIAMAELSLESALPSASASSATPVVDAQTAGSAEVSGVDEDQPVSQPVEDTDTAASGLAKLSRKQRRALKKDEAEAEVEDEGAGPIVKDLRGQEMAAIQKQLTSLSMSVHVVPADGHCLFYAVQDQLAGIGGTTGSSGNITMSALRKRAADYIRTQWLDFAPFLPYEDSDMYDSANETAGREAVQRYTHRLEHTAAWGGHPELRALACTLGVPIVVYQMGAEPLVFHPAGDEGARAPGGAALRLSFHRHYLSLGEHYNSVRRGRSQLS